MGCDIHAYIEVKENEEWKHYDWRNQFIDGKYSDGSPSYDYSKMMDYPLYIGRNYDLFAILANVRNGRGFAGILTGTGFKPIDMPRGLPQDVCKEVQEISDGWDVDGHSHSWLLLKELIEYDYDNQFTTQYAVVNKKEYQTFKQNGKPDYYSGDVSGSRVIKVSNAEMEQIISGQLGQEEGKEYYTQITWNESYKESVGNHWFEVLKEMKKLGSPENVRLVFFFDN